MTRCPEDKIIVDNMLGLRICTETGEVIEENVIDDGIEWRGYTPEEKERRSRVGGFISPLFPHMGVTADLVYSYGKSDTSKIRGFRKAAEKRRLKPVRDRMESRVLSLIGRTASKLGLPDSIREEAARLYRDIASKGLIRSHSVEETVIACLYISCLRLRTPCKIEEIIDAVHSLAYDVKRLKHDVRIFVKNVIRSMNIRIPVIEPEAYVERIASRMEVKENVIAEAVRLLREAREKGLKATGNPYGLAAGALYITCKKFDPSITMENIAKAAGVTEVTVRKNVKKLKEFIDGKNM